MLVIWFDTYILSSFKSEAWDFDNVDCRWVEKNPSIFLSFFFITAAGTSYKRMLCGFHDITPLTAIANCSSHTSHSVVLFV